MAMQDMTTGFSKGYALASERPVRQGGLLLSPLTSPMGAGRPYCRQDGKEAHRACRGAFRGGGGEWGKAE